MPELPEVETVCRSLRQTVLHQKIKIVDIYLPRLIQQPSAEEVKALLPGCCFVAVRRRGKYILLELSNGMTLVVHLRMTGKLLYVSEEEPLGKHTHIVMTLKIIIHCGMMMCVSLVRYGC